MVSISPSASRCEKKFVSIALNSFGGPFSTEHGAADPAQVQEAKRYKYDVERTLSGRLFLSAPLIEILHLAKIL